MPVSYLPAPEVERVARDVIAANHAHLLANAVHVVYLFTDEAEKKAGKVVLGTARKKSGLDAYLARRGDDWDGSPDFFLVCVWETWWTSRATTDAQRRALVDHELMHLWSDEERNKQTGETTGKILLSILPHDITEFNEIARRHGAWQPDIEAFVSALRGSAAWTPGLFDGEADEGESDESDADGGAGVGVTISHGGRSVSLSGERLNAIAKGTANYAD